MQSIAFIGLGSNLGDGRKTLLLAWQQIGKTAGISILELSSPYLSEPVGMTSSNWFTNAVGKLQTSLTADELLRIVLQVEADFGRVRDDDATGYQDRTLDLDILYYDRLVQQQEELTLPHPFLGERLFVLEPLAEIGADFLDPQDDMTVGEKLQKLRRQMKDGRLPLQEIRKSAWQE